MTIQKRKEKIINMNRKTTTGDDTASKTLKGLCTSNLPVSPTSKQPCPPELLHQNQNHCQL